MEKKVLGSINVTRSDIGSIVQMRDQSKNYNNVNVKHKTVGLLQQELCFHRENFYSKDI